MGIEYTIKRKSFSQTYSTRHLTRLLCFFTTNLRVINKNKATKTKMYITFSYIVVELLGTEIVTILEHICQNCDKTYIFINVQTLNMSIKCNNFIACFHPSVFRQQDFCLGESIDNFYGYLRRLVPFYMVKNFYVYWYYKFIKFVSKNNKLEKFVLYYYFSPIPQYTATKEYVLWQNGEIGFFNSSGIHKTKAIFV